MKFYVKYLTSDITCQNSLLLFLMDKVPKRFKYMGHIVTLTLTRMYYCYNSDIDLPTNYFQAKNGNLINYKETQNNSHVNELKQAVMQTVKQTDRQPSSSSNILIFFFVKQNNAHGNK